jgi:hypothetical protein
VFQGKADVAGGNRNGLNGAKRLNGWNDWNGIHCEQGIFVSIIINTKAKSKPPKTLNSLSLLSWSGSVCTFLVVS